MLSISTEVIATPLDLPFSNARPVDLIVFIGSWIVAAPDTAIYVIEKHRAKRRERRLLITTCSSESTQFFLLMAQMSSETDPFR